MTKSGLFLGGCLGSKKTNEIRLRIARNLTEARQRAGLTQEELGQRTGTPRSSIANWEQGGTAIPLEKAKPLCEALGISLEQLTDTEPESMEPSKTGRPKRK